MKSYVLFWRLSKHLYHCKYLCNNLLWQTDKQKHSRTAKNLLYVACCVQAEFIITWTHAHVHADKKPVSDFQVWLAASQLQKSSVIGFQSNIIWHHDKVFVVSIRWHLLELRRHTDLLTQTHKHTHQNLFILAGTSVDREEKLLLRNLASSPLTAQHH